MKSSKWADFVPPDLSHADAQKAAEAIDANYRARSVLPDPLTIMIAAESRHPILVPLVPIGPLSGPDGRAPCPHNGPIAEGSVFVCILCHDTGMRNHPAMVCTVADILEPERADEPAEPTRYVPRKPARKPTRKQKRAAAFANRRKPDDVGADPPAAAAG